MAESTGDMFTEGDYLLGVEGLALLRASQDHDFESIVRRRAEIKAILDAAADLQPYARRRDLTPIDLKKGYTIWADTFDVPDDQKDPIETTEQPVMRALMDEFGDGPILDAGCGTGRHTAYLLSIGKTDVTGTDAVEAMLEKAKQKCPGVEFQVADLDSQPFADASFDAIVCGLAYSHLKDLKPASNELARVLRPGGRMIVSAPHPYVTGVLGWRAPLFDAEGNGWEMPEYYNTHQRYIEAFVGAGLSVRQCIEPRLSAAQAKWNPAGLPTAEDAALEQALTGQPAVFVWDLVRA
jgi:SAM-dependent methyltransferase